jgi:hypothetical protein
MDGAKMTLLKETMKLLLGDLVSKDRVGLVTFDSSVKEPLPLQPLTSEAKTVAEGVIDKLKAGSATNLSGGLFKGIQLLLDDVAREKNNQKATKKASKEEEASRSSASAPPPPSRCRTILLMTDGQANVGVQDASQIVPIVKTMLSSGGSGSDSSATSDHGITLHTFGYGSDHDSELLREVATAGQGSYYYVEGVDDIRGAFGDCLGGLLSVVAQNLELTVEVIAPPAAAARAGGGDGDGVGSEGVYGGGSGGSGGSTGGTAAAVITKVHHKDAVTAGPGRWKIKYSDLYGEEQRDLLVSVTLPPITTTTPPPPPSSDSDSGSSGGSSSSSLISSDVLLCSLSYVDVLAGTPALVKSTVVAQRCAGPISCEDQNKRDAKLDLQATRLKVAETLDGARLAAEKGDLKSAREMVSKTRAEVVAVSERCRNVAAAEESGGGGGGEMLPVFLEDLAECEDGLVDERTFYGKKHKMAMMAEGHMQQRCMESTIEVERRGGGDGGGGSSLRSNAYRTKAKEFRATKWTSGF